MGHWGPHFPRVFDPGINRYTYHHWGGPARGVHFPEAAPVDVIPPVTPTGAGAFELVLEEGATMTLAWKTGVSKAFDGREKRSSIVEDPAARFEGRALMVEAHTRAARGRLVRYAAQGASFLLGLPWEAAPVVVASPNYEVFVPQTAALDWCVPGQPAIVHHETYGSLVVTVQSKTATSITVDVPDGTPLGARGGYGAVIMPAVAIYLDAQQGFARYQSKLERWNLKARNANPGFQQAALVAELALSGIFAGLTIAARSPGTAGNAIEVSLFGGSVDPAGTFTDAANNVQFQAMYGTTTVQNFIDAINSSTQVRILGTPPNPAATIGAPNAFGPLALTGGAAQQVVPMGLTATLTEFEDRPVWDRGLDVDGTVADSVQSMNEPQDLGGLPFTAQTADRSDWGRGIAMSRPMGPQFQWLKKFLYTVKGSWKSFWLPTWRKDLVATAVGVGTMTITSGEAAGDFFAWYPEERDTLMVRLASGAVTYARISNAVDNGNGTITLSLVDDAAVAISLASVPTLVSWMEICRLDSDQVSIRFDTFRFSFSALARAVWQ